MLTKQQQGFTLTELMIALTVGSILLVSMIALFATTVRYSHETLNAARLNQQLETAVTMMSQDIRRAGYWANANNNLSSGTNTNPFMAVATDLAINGTGDCIKLSYDNNANGLLPTINTADDDERYSFRLDNGVLQARPASAAFDCTAATNTWEDLTDANVVTITALSFVQSNKVVDLDGAGAGTATLTVRDVTISLTGQLADDASVTKTLTHTIRVRNDKFTP